MLALDYIFLVSFAFALTIGLFLGFKAINLI